MRGSLRDQVEHPGLRLKRSRDQLQAPGSPAGRSLGCVMTTESETENDRPTTWVTLDTFKLRREVLSVPLLTPCGTRGLCANAALPCSRMDLMDRKCWLGLLELEEETVFPRAEQRTRQDLQPLTQQVSPREIGLTTVWSVERPSA